MALSLQDVQQPDSGGASGVEVTAQPEYSQLAGSASIAPKTMDGVRPADSSSAIQISRKRLRSTGVRPATTTDIRAPAELRSRTESITSIVTNGASGTTTTLDSRGTDWRAVALTIRDNVAQTLNHQQSQQSLAQREQAKEYEQRRSGVKKPSKMLYYPLIYLSVVIDMLGLLTLTGIGAVIVWLINVIASIFFFLIGLFLGKKIKKTRTSGEDVSKIIANAEERINLYRNRISAIVRYAERSAAGRSILRSSIGRKGITWAAKGLKWFNSPVVKRSLPLVAELIPIMNMLPWYTINTVLTYREHKKEYTLSLQTLGEFPPKVQEETAAFAELHYNQLLEGAAAVKGAFQQLEKVNAAMASLRKRTQQESQPSRQTRVRDIVPASAAT